MDGALCGLFWPGSFGQALLARLFWPGSFGQSLMGYILWTVRCAGSLGQALLAKVLWGHYVRLNLAPLLVGWLIFMASCNIAYLWFLDVSVVSGAISGAVLSAVSSAISSAVLGTVLGAVSSAVLGAVLGTVSSVPRVQYRALSR